MWKVFTDCFNCLPVVAIIDEKIMAMHGGLSPELKDMDQIKHIMRPTDIPDTGTFLFIYSNEKIIKDYYVICYGQTQKKKCQDGQKMTEEYHIRSGQMWFRNS